MCQWAYKLFVLIIPYKTKSWNAALKLDMEEEETAYFTIKCQTGYLMKQREVTYASRTFNLYLQWVNIKTNEGCKIAKNRFRKCVLKTGVHISIFVLCLPILEDTVRPQGSHSSPSQSYIPCLGLRTYGNRIFCAVVSSKTILESSRAPSCMATKFSGNPVNSSFNDLPTHRSASPYHKSRHYLLNNISVTAKQNLSQKIIYAMTVI
jgi:hypothetical protein